MELSTNGTNGGLSLRNGGQLAKPKIQVISTIESSFQEKPPPSAICVRQLNLSYRVLFSLKGIASEVIYVLNGINLTVPAGTIYGLLGPSGCGKTSLLRCI